MLTSFRWIMLNLENTNQIDFKLYPCLESSTHSSSTFSCHKFDYAFPNTKRRALHIWGECIYQQTFLTFFNYLCQIKCILIQVMFDKWPISSHQMKMTSKFIFSNSQFDRADVSQYLVFIQVVENKFSLPMITSIRNMQPKKHNARIQTESITNCQAKKVSISWTFLICFVISAQPNP